MEPLPQTGTRYQLTRDGGSHPMWLPDGQALYFDRDHQMFRLAVHTKDLSARVEPAALPIKGFAQAEYRRQFDVVLDHAARSGDLPRSAAGAGTGERAGELCARATCGVCESRRIPGFGVTPRR